MNFRITDGPSKSTLVARVFNLAEAAVGDHYTMPIMFTVESNEEDFVGTVDVMITSVEYRDKSGHSFTLRGSRMRVYVGPPPPADHEQPKYSYLKISISYDTRRRQGLITTKAS